MTKINNKYKLLTTFKVDCIITLTCSFLFRLFITHGETLHRVWAVKFPLSVIGTNPHCSLTITNDKFDIKICTHNAIITWSKTVDLR